MRAIKINVETKEIFEIEIDSSLEDIYKHLECRTFSCPVILKDNDALYVDDEGLFVDFVECKGAFNFTDFPYQPLFGNGLIVGTNDEGESEDCKVSLDEIKSKITFLKRHEVMNNLKRLQNTPPSFINIV